MTTQIQTPTGLEEEWRFTPLKRLVGLHDGSAIPQGSLGLAIDGDIAEYSLLAADDALVIPEDSTNDAVVLHVRAQVEQVHYIKIPKESRGIVRIRRTGQGGVCFSRYVVDVERHAEVTLTMENFGTVSLAEEVEIRIAEEAQVRFISSQEWDRQTVHVARHRARLGRNAKFVAHHISLGGDLVRISPRVDYSGPGGDAELNGIYFAQSGQHLEHRLHVEHDVVNCKSRVTYKGALHGDAARTVWFGDVAIRAVAEGTDTYELNRNLILSDGARADSVPNLEIETGEIVGAGHASATGRFDDEHLFYLQSRGISEQEARKLVVRGFFAELINTIGIQDIQERLMSLIDDTLERSNA